MPYLYCELHGREKEAEAAGSRAVHRDEGATVLIVAGALKSGPWHCDRCNARLGKGARAVLLTPLPAWITERYCHYDFAHEKRYFAMKGGERIATYGALWPGFTDWLAAGGWPK